MKIAHFYLASLTILFSSCNATYEIRKGVSGNIINSDTNLPIDSVSISFLVGYKSGGMATEITRFSDDTGYFKIEPLRKKTNYDGANTLRDIHSKYLKVKKDGYQSDTIFIENPAYRKDIDESTVLLDTVYLEPVVKQ